MGPAIYLYFYLHIDLWTHNYTRTFTILTMMMKRAMDSQDAGDSKEMEARLKKGREQERAAKANEMK